MSPYRCLAPKPFEAALHGLGDAFVKAFSVLGKIRTPRPDKGLGILVLPSAENASATESTRPHEAAPQGAGADQLHRDRARARDISYCPLAVRGQHWYLYLIMDI